MPGLNHVEPGGRPLVLLLSPTVSMTKVSVGPMDNNAYLLQTREGATVLVDAANDADRLLAIVGDGLVDTIVTTHQHPDHWQALAAVAEATGARLVAGRPDAEAIAGDAGVSGVQPVWDGDTVRLGAEELAVIGLVGHTPGSITLAYTSGGATHLFTGDSLFPGGPGRTTTPGDFTSLMDDLERKVFGVFGDDAVVHPGHGDDTTLGAERPHLPEWRDRGW
jgi:glyoxylase-like metal-dependent hydrolase (beta-lactamase superfamily II)